jgi:hypothetical protein
LREELRDCDVVIALDPRGELERAGIAIASRRLIDLRPPKPARLMDSTGRVLWITPELLVRGTLGRGRTLSDPRALGALARGGKLEKLHRQLAADLETLHALHSYGRMHGHVRLRWGSLNDYLTVSWGVPPHGTAAQVLERACREKRAVELVLHEAPEWSDPWSRAEAFEVLSVSGWPSMVELRRRETTEKIEISLLDVHAIRELPADAVAARDASSDRA